jgi:hypothetical protein
MAQWQDGWGDETVVMENAQARPREVATDTTWGACTWARALGTGTSPSKCHTQVQLPL